MLQLAEERQKQILEKVQAEGEVVISRAAATFAVSEMTIRRDLRLLENHGLIARVHGGAVNITGATFKQRLATGTKEKAEVARKILPLLPKQGTIYLDGSTTMLSLVSLLRHAQSLHVATNNVETFARLGLIPGVEPLLLGGKLDRRTDNLVGTLAMRSILAIAFDAAFFSAWGLDCKLGPMEVTLEDAEVKDLVASRTNRIVLAVDDSKLGIRANGTWRPEKEKTTLVTNLKPKHKRLREYRSGFARIV